MMHFLARLNTRARIEVMSLENFRVPARLWGCLCLSGLLAACAMPPREAMRIIRSQGLIPYLTGTYHPGMLGSGLLHQSRPSYLYSRPGFVRVPYRPVMAATPPSTRYMVDGETPMPYRPKPRSTPRRVEPESSTVTTAPSTSNPPRETPPSTPKPSAGTEVDPVASLPFGSPVPGRPGMVNSPYAQKRQLVDVTGMSPGETVKDPYTGKLFRVPPLPEASSPPPAPKSAPAPAPSKEAAPSAPSSPPASVPPKEEPPAAPKTAPAPAPKDKPATVESAGGQTT